MRFTQKAYVGQHCFVLIISEYNFCVKNKKLLSTQPLPPPENISKESTKNWNKSPLTWDSCFFFYVDEVPDRVFSLLISNNLSI